MLNKEKVKELYLQGLNFNQIAIVLNAKSETVRKCIQRNLKEFKKSHQAAKLRNKEVDRITKYESKQYMSDRTFILKNRSIYKTKSNGDIVLNNKVSGTVSFDTPRRLANADKCVIN